MRLFRNFPCILLLVTSCVDDNTAGTIVDAPLVSTAAGHVDNQPVDVGDTQMTASYNTTPSDVMCPNSAAIFPCFCTVDYNHNIMDLDCSEVRSEEELSAIMRTYFPSPNFHKLIINNNNNVRVLRAETLANITFQQFWIVNGLLEVVKDGALSASYSTVTSMWFDNNRIDHFCWKEISSFTNLQMLSFKSNRITNFPVISSGSLRYLNLGHNPLELVPLPALSDTPALEEVYFDGTGLQDIIPGTFFGLPELWMVVLEDNHLTEVPEGAVWFNSSSPHGVYLRFNNITRVDVYAFSGFFSGDTIDLSYNQLAEVEEEVWRPLLLNGVRLKLRDNPLTCGCDIAWVVLNNNFLSHIDDRTTCSDGEPLVDLDPTWYEEMC
ncbi:oplophorus-luciferin 2-monooxygenase non-catalytic subunit-like [Homarus americanus]|nr:oplophorus-luciferin 2-monooxygenase non-catalytic subunit-like [Homarus americanus]